MGRWCPCLSVPTGSRKSEFLPAPSAPMRPADGLEIIGDRLFIPEVCRLLRTGHPTGEGGLPCPWGHAVHHDTYWPLARPQCTHPSWKPSDTDYPAEGQRSRLTRCGGLHRSVQGLLLQGNRKYITTFSLEAGRHAASVPSRRRRATLSAEIPSSSLLSRPQQRRPSRTRYRRRPRSQPWTRRSHARSWCTQRLVCHDGKPGRRWGIRHSSGNP